MSSRRFALVVCVLIAFVVTGLARADVLPEGKRISVEAKLTGMESFADYAFIGRFEGRFSGEYRDVTADGRLPGGGSYSGSLSLFAIRQSDLAKPQHAELRKALSNAPGADPRLGMMKARTGQNLPDLSVGQPDCHFCDEKIESVDEFATDASNAAVKIERTYAVAGFQDGKPRVYLAKEVIQGPGGAILKQKNQENPWPGLRTGAPTASPAPGASPQ